MVTIARDDSIRSLTAADLVDGRWMDAAAVHLYLGVKVKRGEFIMRMRHFPAHAMTTSDGTKLWDIVAVSDWIRVHVKAATPPGEVCLYRHFDKDGALLYVGISMTITNRTRAHCFNAPWFRDVRNISVEWHPSRLAAEEAEKLAIRTENPRFNKTYAVRS